MAASQTAQGILNIAQSQINLINGSAYSDSQSLLIRMNNTISTLKTLFQQGYGGSDYNGFISYAWSQSMQQLNTQSQITLNTGIPSYISCLSNPTTPC